MRISIKITNPIFVRIISVIILFLMWEINAQAELFKIVFPDLPNTFFPSLKEIFNEFIFEVIGNNYFTDLWTSLWRVFVSFGLATILGVSIGLLSARYKVISDVNFYTFEFFRQLPAVAIIPFAIIIFGIGGGMKIFVGFFGCFFPIYLSTVQSLQGVDEILLNTATKYGWNGKKLIFGVMLPASAPNIVSILRVTLTISLILIITAEMIVGGEGLGARLVLKERSFNFKGLYAETLALGVIGLLLNYTFHWLTSKLIFWKPKLDWSKN